MTWTWAEPFAGAAACTLRLVGGADLSPPVAWMGGKRRYARAILDAMGVPETPPSRVLLADAGPWGWVWPLLLKPADAAKVARVLRSWAGEHPRDLWQRLADRPPYLRVHERAAQWLWLQARSASGVPIWWDGWRHVASDGRGDPRPAGQRADHPRWNQADHATGRTMRAAQSGRGWQANGKPATDRGEDLRWPGHQAERARWERASSGGRESTRPPAQRTRGWRFAGRPDRVQEDRAAGPSGDKSARTGGMVNPCTIAERIEAIAEAFRGVSWGVAAADARDLEVAADGRGRVRDLWIYLDPPYVGATGYGWDMPRAEVLGLARRWADAGAVVAVSEAEPLDLPGWHQLELTREGGKPEWLTLSRAPARRPERQALLAFPEDL